MRLVLDSVLGHVNVTDSNQTQHSTILAR